MKNYDAIMEKMSPEAMAELNVRLVTVENRRLFYMTSAGQLFPTDKYEDAVRFEYQWLNFDPETAAAQAEAEAPAENCDTCDEKCAE